MRPIIFCILTYSIGILTGWGLCSSKTHDADVVERSMELLDRSEKLNDRCLNILAECAHSSRQALCSEPPARIVDLSL